MECLEVDELPGLLGVVDQVELVFGPGLDHGGGEDLGLNGGVLQGVRGHHVRVVEVLRVGARRRDQCQYSDHVALLCPVLALLAPGSPLILLYQAPGIIPGAGQPGSACSGLMWVRKGLHWDNGEWSKQLWSQHT